MKEKDKVLQALCDGLGENYKLMEIDLELCIYRNFGNRFDGVEFGNTHQSNNKPERQRSHDGKRKYLNRNFCAFHKRRHD